MPDKLIRYPSTRRRAGSRRLYPAVALITIGSYTPDVAQPLPHCLDMPYDPSKPIGLLLQLTDRTHGCLVGRSIGELLVPSTLR